jgi:hypothetical protein
MKAAAIARLGHPLVERTRGELDGVLNRVASTHEHHPVLDQLSDLVRERARLLETWLLQGSAKGG